MSVLKLNIKKLVTAFVLITIPVSLYFPFAEKARAAVPLFVPVWDPGNFSVNTVSAVANKSQTVKEYILDAVLYKIMDLMIQRMTASTVKWINSGFQDTPAYITDPTAYFKDIGDKVAGDFIFNDPRFSALCGPINARIKIALSEKYNRRGESWECTLSDAYGNMENFINDFERGGWTKFFRLTQEPQNNPIGAYLQAEIEMQRKINQKAVEKDKELTWGVGFMSKKECLEWKNTPIPNMDGTMGSLTVPSCVKEKTITPGSVIEEQLGSVLSIGNQKLAVADEINEIISALLNQVVSRVVGGIGGGLKGMSSSDPTNEGKIFTQQLYSTTSDPAILRYINESERALREASEAEASLGTYNPYTCRDNPSLPECLPPGEPADTGTTTVNTFIPDPSQTP